MQRLLIGIVVVALVAGGAWVYLTRAPSAPSEDVSAGTEVLPPPADFSLTPAPGNEPVQYRISQEESQVSFEIDEVLRGEDFTVVGTTNQVAGDIIVPNGDLEETEFGPVRVNARTLKTDSTQRDGAIARAILRSEDPANEFITFAVTSVRPGSGPAGAAEIPVAITGNLTISGTTQPVTFEGTLQQLGDTEITGSAEATVQYKNFNLVIPEVPFVASVSDDVLLTIDFVAKRVE